MPAKSLARQQSTHWQIVHSSRQQLVVSKARMQLYLLPQGWQYSRDPFVGVLDAVCYSKTTTNQLQVGGVGTQLRQQSIHSCEKRPGQLWASSFGLSTGNLVELLAQAQNQVFDACKLVSVHRSAKRRSSRGVRRCRAVGTTSLVEVGPDRAWSPNKATNGRT